jgi:prepilin-type N-terminal cleavage/methylation domain-containing protein
MITRKQFRQKIKLVNLKGQICSSQSGFTIIESLVAIIMVSILLAAIAPAIILSVGTRVQARRIETASQAVRSYIDGVRSGTIPPPQHTISLTEVISNNFSSQRSTFAGVAAPSGTLSCASSTTGFPYCSNSATSSLYCIDRDGGGCTSSSFQDLIVQTYRSTTNTSATAASDVDKGYLLSIKVYRADAFDGTSLTATGSQKSFGTALTLAERKRPLITMTTEIGSSNTKFQDYCARYGGCQ